MYRKADLKLLGIYGDSLKLYGSALEWNECFFCEKNRRGYVIGLPSWWTKSVDQLNDRMYFWDITESQRVWEAEDGEGGEQQMQTKTIKMDTKPDESLEFSSPSSTTITTNPVNLAGEETSVDSTTPSSRFLVFRFSSARSLFRNNICISFSGTGLKLKLNLL